MSNLKRTRISDVLISNKALSMEEKNKVTTGTDHIQLHRIHDQCDVHENHLFEVQSPQVEIYTLANETSCKN